MPKDVALVTIGVLIVFGIFSVALAWVDRYTNGNRKT